MCPEAIFTVVTTHALEEQALSIKWNGFVIRGDHVPSGERFPRWDAHDVAECTG